MKIRTDFVTNSSSSSFIFKEFNRERLKSALEEIIGSVPSKDEREDYNYQWARQVVDDMDVTRFSELYLYDLEEVVNWYEEERLEELLDVPKVDNDGDWDEIQKKRENWKEDIKNKLAEELSEEIAMCLAAKFVLDLYGYASDDDTTPKTVVTEKFVYNTVWEYFGKFGYCSYCREVLYDYYVINLESILERTKAFYGMTLGEVAEHWFDSKYIYFEGFEIIYYVRDAASKLEECTYCCIHMG